MRKIIPYCIRLLLFLSVVMALLIWHDPIYAQSDSLNIRKADSTDIVIDYETVPVVIRSRMQELSVLYPLGVFPREETAESGFWQREVGPQYGRVFYADDMPIKSRYRPAVPLRYFPQHAITGFHFAGDDSMRYLLRTYTLRRNEEPKVNVVYKKGDYALGALSVALAVDVTENTHLHLFRESEGYVGQYGIDGIETERYGISAFHDINDSTRFTYSTYYTKDKIGWVAFYLNAVPYGSESSSWYENFLRWSTNRNGLNLDFGLKLGSQRLWFSGQNWNNQPTSLQRGLWLSATKSLGERLSAGLRYELTNYDLSSDADGHLYEFWHTVTGNLEYNFSGLRWSNSATIRKRSGNQNGTEVFGKTKVVYSLPEQLQLTAELNREIRYAPWQWSFADRWINAPINGFSATDVTSFKGEVNWKPLHWLSLQGTGEHLEYSNWYTLQYEMPAARLDSTLSVGRHTGRLDHLSASLEINPFDWVAAGARYNIYPDLNQPLPEIWSQQHVTGWIHIQRYFFKNNLLLHLFGEAGYYTDRQPVGWHPMLQSITMYPLFSTRPDLGYGHAYIAGEVGPFTLGLSFYNVLNYNLQYAIDQRSQTNIFYLSVRWQFWD